MARIEIVSALIGAAAVLVVGIPSFLTYRDLHKQSEDSFTVNFDDYWEKLVVPFGDENHSRVERVSHFSIKNTASHPITIASINLVYAGEGNVVLDGDGKPFGKSVLIEAYHSLPAQIRTVYHFPFLTDIALKSISGKYTGKTVEKVLSDNGLDIYGQPNRGGSGTYSACYNNQSDFGQIDSRASYFIVSTDTSFTRFCIAGSDTGGGL